MILLICEDGDAAASWAARGLAQRGLAVRTLTGSDLARVHRWEHRIGAHGIVFEASLEDGTTLRRSDITGVLNRLSYIPAAWLARTGGPDRDYAAQEMYAFYLSWLNAIPGLRLNAPAPQGLCGNWRHRSAWVALAARAGLPSVPYHLASSDDPDAAWTAALAPGCVTTFVAAGRVIGPPALPFALEDGCRRLAALAGADLLGIDFTVSADAGDWQFLCASVAPDLLLGGEALIDALAAAFSASPGR